MLPSPSSNFHHPLFLHPPSHPFPRLLESRGPSLVFSRTNFATQDRPLTTVSTLCSLTSTLSSNRSSFYQAQADPSYFLLAASLLQPQPQPQPQPHPHLFKRLSCHSTGLPYSSDAIGLIRRHRHRKIHTLLSASASSSSSSSFSHGISSTISSTRDPIKDFSLRPFNPPSTFSWFWKNCHVQTIAGQFYPPPPTFEYDTRRTIETPCGDFFHVDFKYATSTVSSLSQSLASWSYSEAVAAAQQQEFLESRTNPVVVICHGLESCSAGPTTKRLAQGALDKGFDVVAINYRGCSGQLNRNVAGYHLGFTDDLELLLTKLTKNKWVSNSQPIYLMGFSLGANIAGKFLGQSSTKAKSKYNIHGAALTCVPFAPAASQPILDSGLSHAIYSSRILRSLKKKAMQQYKLHPHAFDLDKVLKCKTIGEFDDCFVSKIYKYEGMLDYYAKNCLIQFLESIHVPTLILNARDDPFMNPETFPCSQKIGNRNLLLVQSEYGGHMGFVESPFAPPPSYLGTELARFLHHIHLNSRE